MNNNSWRDLSPSLVQVLCSPGCRCVWWTLPIRTVPAVISLAILSWSECKLTKQHFWQLCRWRITCYPGENAALLHWCLYQPGWVTVLVSRGLKALGLDVLNITPKLGILYSNALSTDLNKRITIFCTFSENDFFLNFPIHPWKRLWKTGGELIDGFRSAPCLQVHVYTFEINLRKINALWWLWNVSDNFFLGTVKSWFSWQKHVCFRVEHLLFRVIFRKILVELKDFLNHI